MNNIKYILFTILFIFLNIFYVNASCTDDDIANLKDLADDIKITYKHMGKIEYEDEVYYNRFEVRVKNISDELYISLLDGEVILTPSDGEIVYTFNNGTWTFSVYSNKCEEKLNEIEVYIPRFNMYSLDPLCEGVDGNDFSLCGKYYEYDVSYESFKERVNYYLATHNIDDNDDSLVEDEENIFDTLISYLIQYQIYVIVVLFIILLIIIITIILNRRKKRGVLE